MNHTNGTHHGIEVVGFHFDKVGGLLVDGLCVVIAAVIKVGYHHVPYLGSYVPESCILIILGVIAGVIVRVAKADHSKYVPHFTTKLFSFFLLPPIILESAYSLYDRNFFSNVISILIYAILGTVINILLIAGSLFACGEWSAFRVKIPFVQILLFSTLISAVDPVAVLAIFQEVNVNPSLYFLVFGESLLNDAVVITVYNAVSAFAGPIDFDFVSLLKAIAAFIIGSLGGFTFGVIMGAFTALATKYTRGVRVMEPLIVIVLAYLAYVGAEVFHFSGIISIIGCGLVQAEYARHNVSRKSYTTIKYITKTLSAIADVIIFLFLGVVLIRDTHIWDTGFVLLTVVFCLIYRFASVFSLTYLLNMVRMRRINLEYQAIMAYGGLRGAIAFSLCLIMDNKYIQQNNIQMFTTTALVVILFTVFVLGSTTKPIVRFLKVQSQSNKNLDEFMEIHEKVLDKSISGIESVTGQRSMHYWMQKVRRFNEIYVKRYLIKGHSATSKLLKETYDKIFKEGMISEMTTNEFYQKLKMVKKETKNEDGYGEIETINVSNGRVHPSPIVSLDRRRPSTELRNGFVKQDSTKSMVPRINTVSRFKATLILQPEDLSPKSKRLPISNKSDLFYKRN